jgi:hypothetical protein
MKNWAKRILSISFDTGLVAAKMIGEDRVKRPARLRFMFVVPVWVVPATAVGHLCDLSAAQALIPTSANPIEIGRYLLEL